MTPSTSARVKVPATSANLGAGFDCVGMAVDRWLSASVTVHGTSPDPSEACRAVVIERRGTLASLDVKPPDDAIYRGFVAACEARGRAIPARLDFVVDSEIPFGRGLGSSSAALVAGARLASTTLGIDLRAVEIASICATIEGHPDNVAPAALGGLVLAVPDGRAGRWTFAALPVHDSIAFVFIVPPFLVETARARAALPAEVAHATAVAAAGKAAALVQGLASGDRALLRVALDDVLHVPYRRALVPGLAKVYDAACAAGAFGLTLSGSGSTLVAVAPHGGAHSVASAVKLAWAAEGIVAEAFVQHRPAHADTAEK